MASQSQPPKRCRLSLERSALCATSENRDSMHNITESDEVLRHKSTDLLVADNHIDTDADCGEPAVGFDEGSSAENRSTEITDAIYTCAYTLEASEENVLVHVDPVSHHKAPYAHDSPDTNSGLSGVDSTAAEKSACVRVQKKSLKRETADVVCKNQQRMLTYFWARDTETTSKINKTPDPEKKIPSKSADLEDSASVSESTSNEIVPEISDFSDECSIASSEDGHCDLGIPMEDLPSRWTNSPSLPPLQATIDSTVLFCTDVEFKNLKSAPIPFPTQLIMENVPWDDDFVRMPYAVQNKFVDAGKSVVGRWSVITASLEDKQWSSSRDIEIAITRYNKHKWDFTGLHRYCDNLAEEELEQLFEQILPKIAKLALALPSLCTQPIPLLHTQREASITMSQEQAASLLANAFFCTFPARNVVDSRSSSPQMPSINFNGLFRRAHGPYESSQRAKLDCLLNYFRRVTAETPQGTITYRRQVLSNNPDWANSDEKLTDLCVTANGTIEDRADGMLHVDFANKVIGGGVLGEGCVQEEIRFVICPEMIVARVFTEQLAENECLVMSGAERFSNYSGYGSTFRWVSDHRDVAPRDDWGRLVNEIVAIDAKVFHSLGPQLAERNLRRELNKAFCGFSGGKSDYLCAVATGNWGCGAFGGDHRLKALLQMMAAAQARRAVCYFTFGDVALSRDIYKVHEAARAANCTVGRLWEYIRSADARLSSNDIYRRIISDHPAKISNIVPDSPCYEENTP